MKTTDEIHLIVTGSQQFGCPHSRDPRSEYAGTGGPAPSSTFTNLVTGEVVTRDAGARDASDESADKTTNDAGALSMANTGNRTAVDRNFSSTRRTTISSITGDRIYRRVSTRRSDAVVEGVWASPSPSNARPSTPATPRERR